MKMEVCLVSVLHTPVYLIQREQVLTDLSGAHG